MGSTRRSRGRQRKDADGVAGPNCLTKPCAASMTARASPGSKLPASIARMNVRSRRSARRAGLDVIGWHCRPRADLDEIARDDAPLLAVDGDFEPIATDPADRTAFAVHDLDGYRHDIDGGAKRGRLLRVRRARATPAKRARPSAAQPRRDDARSVSCQGALILLPIDNRQSGNLHPPLSIADQSIARSNPLPHRDCRLPHVSAIADCRLPIIHCRCGNRRDRSAAS